MEHQSGGSESGGWCFEGVFGVDLEFKGRKICGSAQRVFGVSVLQHGSLFLEDTSEMMRRISSSARAGEKSGAGFTNLREATGGTVRWDEMLEAFKSGFESALGVLLEPGRLTPDELEMRRSVDG